MTGLYRGANRYHVVFRQIADFSQPAPAGREAAVRDADRALRRAAGGVLPQRFLTNWFNFYDFWHGADSLPEAAPGAGA